MATEETNGWATDDGEIRTTVAEIADRAGVSVPTVSKVLNGRADVAAATRKRIEKILHDSGYRHRRSTRTNRVPMVDLVFHELQSPWAVELIRGVEAVVRENGTEVVVSECGRSRTPRQEWIDSVLARRPIGVIMVFSDLAADQRSQMDARRIPYVVVDPIGEDDQTVPSVGSNNWNGGRAAAHHLLDLGHRRIAAISGPLDTLCARARMDGYTDALRATGVTPDPGLTRVGDFKFEGGYQAGGELLDLTSPPSAIFAGSDLQALGVIRAARERGLDVPGDLSVVGYDNLPLVQWTWPALTTIDQPLFTMADQATRMVLALAQGETPTVTKMDLAVRLVERDSTAPPVDSPASRS